MTDNKQTKIGFIGLGLMGTGMVSRLQDQGYPLTVLGKTKREAIDAAVERGAHEAKNARELANASDVIMLCVDTSKSVESLMYGPDGIIAGSKPGTIVVAELEKIGAHFLDAPLGRTPTHAYDGLLNIMAAGKKDDYDAVEPILKELGENVFHVGDLGAGHTLKLINNFFGMTLATAMSEAFALSDQAGIDRQDLYNIMSAGPLHSMMMDLVKANAVDGDPTKLAFSIANASKDLGYYTQMTKDLNSPSFIGGATTAALSKAVEQGYGDKAVSVMVDFIAETFSQSNSKE